MKKFLQISAAIALMLSASVALAQNGSDVTGGTVSNTVNGIFVPSAGGAVSIGGTNLAPAPPSTPAPTPPPPAAAAGVMSGAPAAVASFTQALGTSGVPAAAAQGIANALQQAGSNQTAGGLAAAVSTWNAAIQSMTPAQVTALVSTPQGRAAMHAMINAQRAVLNAAFRAR